MFVQLVGGDHVPLTQHHCLKMRLAIAGSTAPRRGSRNSPRCTISFFLPDKGTRLSATLRWTALCLRSFRATQSDNLTSFSTFSTHSQML